MNVNSPPPKSADSDILSPFTSLEWRKCNAPPERLLGAQAVCLGDKLYVGCDKLSIYTTTTNTWLTRHTPVFNFAVVIYHSQLVLVGGQMANDLTVTNKLWTLDRHSRFRNSLPPMTVKRRWVSSVEYSNNIVVAGGEDDQQRKINIVEIYNGHHWANAQSLPIACWGMNSALLNGQWYLAGGVGQVTMVYYTSVESLIASCQPDRRHAPSVWKSLDQVPHVASILVVFGNRLVAMGLSSSRSIKVTSSIHAYSPYSQSWIHVGDVPNAVKAAAVLPTGDLMVVGHSALYGCCIPYRGRLSVTAFDLDSQFTMETLHQLEDGFGDLKDLESCTQQLKDVVGIDSTDSTSGIGLSSLLKQWIQGCASLHPTWRHFFWALREIKLNNLANQIESYLSGMAAEQETSSNFDLSPDSEGEEEKNEGYHINAEEEKHIAAVQKAMEERGMLDHTIVHGVFVGPARSGKNSIMERLLGRMPSTISPSTGVAESVVHVKVIQKSTTFAANVENTIWSIMDYDDEAIKLMVINSESQNQVVIPDISLFEKPDPEEYLDTFASETEVRISETQTPVEVQRDGEKEVDISSASESLFNALPDIPVSAHGTLVRPPALPKSYISAIEIVKIALKRKGRKGIDILQQHFLKTWSLYLTNTGGQMEYQEVLPLLVSGPSIFFFTFRLDRDLHTPYSIEYELADGRNAKPYTSTLTTLEGILQTLATISAMGTFVYKGLQKRNIPLRPKVFLIGTHKDRLKPKKADAIIAELDHQLQRAIKSTSHYEELVEFAYPSQMIFTVNNFSKNESDFHNVRSAVERVVIREEFKMTSPAHWLIFSLALRKIKSPVITYKECMEIGKQCGISEDELDEALHFIHSKMGLIRYFPYEEVKHLIVISPQHLFDKVTELIIGTFTFEKARKQAMDAFKQKGIFSLIEFENISSKTESGIKASDFAKLLEKLRIAAPFKLDGNIMYFIPCVLAHVDASKQSVASKIISKLSSEKVPSLIVTFKCGYCPKGLAGALISYLMANEMASRFSWDLCHEEIFRNQVSFRVGPVDTVVLKIYSTCLKIKFIQGKLKPANRRCAVGEVCSEVCKAIESGICQVTSDINYINAQHFFTFHCGCGGDHPGVLEIVDGIPHNLSCRIKDKIFPLPKGHEVWQIASSKIVRSASQRIESTSSDLCEQQSLNIKLGHEHSLAASLECRQLTQLTDDHHSVLIKQLKNQSAKWKIIGLFLGFHKGELDNIESRPLLLFTAPTSWLDEMLSEWLQWAPGDGRGSTSYATLESLKTALCEADLGAVADTLHV